MSDIQHDPSWWQASDGKWYPPQPGGAGAASATGSDRSTFGVIQPGGGGSPATPGGVPYSTTPPGAAPYGGPTHGVPYGAPPGPAPYGAPMGYAPAGFVGAPGATASGLPSVRGLGIASMVLGIVGAVFALCFYPVAFVCAVVGLPLGGVAMSRISKGRADPSGKGQAVAGVVLCTITIALAVIMMIVIADTVNSLNNL